MQKYNHPLFYSLFFLLVFGCGTNKTSISDPPNILLIMTDDQGWGDLSCHGNPILETPTIDCLAKRSTRFTRFYVSPVCAPTRASLLTGRYHLRTGTSWVTHRKEVMRANEFTLAEMLKTKGYRTGIFGKWHNGEQYPNHPLGQGFDRFFGFCAGHWNNYFNTTLQSNQEEIKTEGFITDVLTDQAIAFLKQPSDSSFFCYIPYNAPHGPFQVPDRYFEKYKGKGTDDRLAAIYGMCENIDDNVSRLLNTLKELDIVEKTIVIFLTDNGPNGVRYNGGMKGIKASVDEGGVRVPFFISWPGKIPEDREINDLAAHIDILPTLADFVDAEIPGDIQIDGYSLKNLILDDEATMPVRNLYQIRNDGEDRYWPGALRNDRYRLTVLSSDRTELYDMVNDPGQSNNLADSLDGMTSLLEETYLKWYADVSENAFEISPIPIGYAAFRKVKIPAPDALLIAAETGHTGLTFQGEMGWANDWLINWKEGDQASWPILVANDGQYHINLFYNMNSGPVLFNLEIADEAKEIQISEAFSLPAVESPDRVDRGEVYQKYWKSYDCGIFQLPKGEHRLKLTALQIPDKSQFELKEFEIDFLKK